MTKTPHWQLAAISSHSAALAECATGRLSLPIESCPGWTMGDLIRHVADVQWFWATIVRERLAAPPSRDERPSAPSDDEAVAALRLATTQLLDALADADSSSEVWTWSTQHDVAFVSRHQVYEAAVHHFDAARAAGAPFELATAEAIDGVDEFLTFLVSSADDPKDDDVAPLAGSFNLRATDASVSWSVVPVSGTNHVAFTHDLDHVAPTVEAPVQTLLLWLYGRVALSGLEPELVAAFRALCWTS